MKKERYWVFQVLLGTLIVLIIVSFFVNAYMTGTSPLGWDTPKYINGMLMVKQGELNEFLAHSLHRDHLLYSLLGGFVSVIFNISPYYIEIFLPIMLSIVLVFAWFHLSRKWFNDRKISTFTLLLTIAWYSTFNFPVFRHANLLGFIFLLVFLTYLPELYEKRKVSKKRLVAFWMLFCLGALTHLHTFIFMWGTLFLTAMVLFIPETIRTKLGFKFKIDEKARKELMRRILFLGSGPFSIFALFFIGKGKRVIYREEFLFDFLSRWRNELFLDFGGFLIAFFFFGIILLAKRVRDSHEFKFKESLLLFWCSVPLLLFCLTLPAPQLGVYARRALLSLPLPLIEALGVNKFLTVLKRNLPFKYLSSLGMHGKHTQMGVLFTGLVLVPTFGTGTLIYRELTPPPRYISHQTVNQLQWIGRHTSKREAPIFIIYTSKQWTASWVRQWEHWIKSYLDDFYIYPGEINSLRKREKPKIALHGHAQQYYNEMKEEGILDNLSQHTIYVLPEFYKHGKFNATEKNHLVPLPHKEIYLLQVPSTTTTIAKNSKRAKLGPPLSSYSFMAKKTITRLDE